MGVETELAGSSEEDRLLKPPFTLRTYAQALRIGRDIYQTQNVLMLVFFPFYTNKIADAERIQETHPEVRCVNLGYKKKHIWQAVQRFY